MSEDRIIPIEISDSITTIENNNNNNNPNPNFDLKILIKFIINLIKLLLNANELEINTLLNENEKEFNEILLKWSNDFNSNVLYIVKTLNEVNNEG